MRRLGYHIATGFLLAGLFWPQAYAQQWQTVERADRPITVNASGVVAPSEGLLFGPPPSRNWRIAITKIAREGQRVKKGDVLAEFDGSTSDERVKSKQTELNTRRSELAALLETQAREIEDDKVRLAAAKSDAEKAARKATVDPSVYAGLEYRKLIEERDVTQAVYEREQSRTVLVERVRASRRAELEADISRLSSELKAAQSELESFTLRAPRDGLVILGTSQEGAKLDVGDSVNPGLTVVELIDDSNLIVTADIPEYAAASLAIGQPAIVTLDAVGGRELTGSVIAVASIVRRQSRFSEAMVRGVSIQFDEGVDISALRPGMSSKVTLTVNTEAAALAVPDAAIRWRDGNPGVEVRGKGWQAVTLGPASAGLRIITTGLEQGMEVAI